MELYVNGNKVDITLEGETTVGDVLKAFEEEASKNEATTVNILLNGENISAEKFESSLNKPLEENTKLELTVITKKDIELSFDESAKYFKTLSEQLEEIPVLLQSGKDSTVSDYIKTLANQIDSFCHTATLSALFPESYKAIKIEEKDISSFFEELAPILKDFEDALNNKDTVTIGDLAEYEISPRLLSLSNAIAQRQ